MMMGITTLYCLIWLLGACSLTKQELAKVQVAPRVTAECGKQLILTCKVSSLEGLAIKHMGWLRTNKQLCSVDSEENMITHNRDALSDFHCEYKNGQLSLIFQEVQPLEFKHTHFMCKLRSNKGATNGVTRVEFPESCGKLAEAVVTKGRPSCTFSHVYPGGDVYWFHGSNNLSDVSQQNTDKRVEEGGYETIHSWLQGNSWDLPINCSLKSTRSGRYIASALMPNAKSLQNGVGSLGALRTLVCIFVLTSCLTNIMDFPK